MPNKTYKDVLLPKYKQILLDRYSDTTFLLQQITKQHQEFDHDWNHINNHPNVAKIWYQNKKEELSQQFMISYLAKLKVKM